MAKPARTCQHIFTSGYLCGAIALRDSDFCYWHHTARERRRVHTAPADTPSPSRNRNVIVPILEDADSIMITLQEVIHAIIEQRLDRQSASLVLYALQTSASLLPHLSTRDCGDQRIVVSIGGEQDEEELALPASFNDADDDDQDEDDGDEDDKNEHEIALASRPLLLETRNS